MEIFVFIWAIGMFSPANDAPTWDEIHNYNRLSAQFYSEEDARALSNYCGDIDAEDFQPVLDAELDFQRVL